MKLKFAMEHDKDLEALISQALLKVERDISLPNNSLVDSTPLQKISGEVRLKKMEVRVDQNFMTRVPGKHIQHSRELRLRKRVAEEEETISLFLDLLLKQ